MLLVKEVLAFLLKVTMKTSPYFANLLGCFLGLSWELVYSGPAKEHVCEGLKPGCSYQTRVYCMSEGGQSPVSHCTASRCLTFFFACYGFFFFIRFGTWCGLWRKGNILPFTAAECSRTITASWFTFESYIIQKSVNKKFWGCKLECKQCVHLKKQSKMVENNDLFEREKEAQFSWNS